MEAFTKVCARHPQFLESSLSSIGLRPGFESASFRKAVYLPPTLIQRRIQFAAALQTPDIDQRIAVQIITAYLGM